MQYAILKTVKCDTIGCGASKAGWEAKSRTSLNLAFRGLVVYNHNSCGCRYVVKEEDKNLPRL